MKKYFIGFGGLIASLLFIGAGCVSVGSNTSTANGSAGMFVSVDKGQNWKQISQQPTLTGVKTLSNTSVFRLVSDPQDSRALYWLSRENGLIYSYDDGNSWQQVTGPMSSGFVYSLVVHPNNKCVIYGTNSQLIYETKDCGRSWHETYRESRSDLQIVSLAMNPFSPYEVYASESNGDLLMSSDNGVSWRVVQRFAVPLAEVVANPIQNGTIYVVTRKNGLYRSMDGGQNWISLATSMKEFSGSLEYRRILVHPTKPNVLYWISTYGILTSADSGDTWSAIDLITPPGSAQIYGFAVNPNNDNEIYYTATINGRSTFYKSVDGGARWTTSKLPSGQTPTILRVHPERDNVVYLGFSILQQKSNNSLFLGQ